MMNTKVPQDVIEDAIKSGLIKKEDVFPLDYDGDDWKIKFAVGTMRRVIKFAQLQRQRQGQEAVATVETDHVTGKYLSFHQSKLADIPVGTKLFTHE